MKALNKIIAISMVFVIILGLVGCGKEVVDGNVKNKEMTLDLSYGKRTGKYTGPVANSLPNGEGKFVSENEEGDSWTYEGNFVNGHFEGEGKTTWKDGAIKIGTYKDDVIVPLSGEELKAFYSEPEKYINHYVEIVGQVFTSPKREDSILEVQVYEDIKNYDNSTLIYIDDKDFEVGSKEFIKVKGKVADMSEESSIFGGKYSTPTIFAVEYSTLDYKDAVAPTLKEVEVNETQTQLGYSITVQKVEFAEEETRVYLKVNNNGSAKFDLYTYSSKVVQNGHQHETETNFDADYPKIQTELLKGVETEGVIIFPKLEQSDMDIVFSGSSENYDERIEDYTFKVKV